MGGKDAELHSFLNMAVDGEWLTPRSGSFTSKKKPRQPLSRGLRGPRSRSRRFGEETKYLALNWRRIPDRASQNLMKKHWQHFGGKDLLQNDVLAIARLKKITRNYFYVQFYSISKQRCFVVRSKGFVFSFCVTIECTNFNAQFSLFINNMFVTLLSSTCFEH